MGQKNNQIIKNMGDFKGEIAMIKFECKLCGHQINAEDTQNVLPEDNPLYQHLKEAHEEKYKILDDFTFEPDSLSVMNFYKIKHK